MKNYKFSITIPFSDDTDDKDALKMVNRAIENNFENSVVEFYRESFEVKLEESRATTWKYVARYLALEFFGKMPPDYDPLEFANWSLDELAKKKEEQNERSTY